MISKNFLWEPTQFFLVFSFMMEQELLDAAKSGNIIKTKFILGYGQININCKDIRLHLAFIQFSFSFIS